MKRRRRSLAGRYQGWLAPFTLQRDSASGFYGRTFHLADRTWTEPRLWRPKTVEKLVRLHVWTPLAPSDPGVDRRPLRRVLAASFDLHGEELQAEPGPVSGWCPPRDLSGIVWSRRAPASRHHRKR